MNEHQGPAEEALKLLVSMVPIDIDQLLWNTLFVDGYEEKRRLVFYILYTCVPRDRVLESLQKVVLDLFGRPETSREVLGRMHEMYHNFY